jgi:hypothetical protein
LADQDHAESLRLKNGKIKNDIETLIYDMKGRMEDEVILKVTSELQREKLLAALSMKSILM